MVSSPSVPPDTDKHTPFSRLVMGAAGPVHDGVRRLMTTLPSHVFIALLLVICAGMGFVQPWQSACVIGYSTVGVGLFYIVVRTGIAERAREPTLAFPQLLFNTSIILLAYTLIPLARGLALQWLCLIILFDMRRLSPRQIRRTAMAAYGVLLVTVCAILRLAPESIDMNAEFVNVGMASVTLCTLLMVTKIGQKTHLHRKQQKKELERTVKQLNALSIRDGLTQLLNRRHVQTLVDEEALRSHRSGRRFSLAILDIDFFKKVNDQHGHAVGDAVLRDVARIAQSAIGSTHALARWGGEEFLLLMPETPVKAAVPVLEKVRRAIREHDWGQHAASLKVTISAGVCEHDGSAQLGPTLERADRALYDAKHAGRDRVVAAAEAMITVLAASS